MEFVAYNLFGVFFDGSTFPSKSAREVGNLEV
jgi:hypothetical protein